MEDIGAIILAGGKSRRMGSDKGLVLFKGKPMILHTIENILRSGIKDILIISKNCEYQKFKLPVYADLIENKGPLGGIFTGLFYSEKEWNIVAPCDCPLVNSKYFELLISEKANQMVTVLKSKKNTHFLTGVFHRSAKDSAKLCIENEELKIERWIESLLGRVISVEDYFDFEEQDFININTENELNQINEYGKV